MGCEDGPIGFMYLFRGSFDYTRSTCYTVEVVHVSFVYSLECNRLSTCRLFYSPDFNWGGATMSRYEVYYPRGL